MGTPSARDLPREVERALVIGASRSGRAGALALAAAGVGVVLSDSQDLSELTGLDELEREGVTIHGGTQTPDLLEGVDLIVKSPGVPGGIPLLEHARRRSVPIWSEIELAYRLLPNAFDAVTGTNGKTTTTALLGSLFEEAGKPVRVLGNIGTAASSVFGHVEADVELVVEVSSFQLEDVHAFRPAAAVFLNLTPDHLDRHGTIRAYQAAKERLFRRQLPEDTAVLNIDDPVGTQLAERLRRRNGGPGVHTFSVRHPGEADSWLEQGRLYLAGEPLLETHEMRLRGDHNMENALAAAGAALARGLPREAVAAGLAAFEGVEHRLQRAGTLAGVTYVNDSKATNVEATLKALDAYPEGTHLILGGRDKGSDYRPVARACAGRCSAVYLMGEAAPLIRNAFTDVLRERAGRGEAEDLPPVLDAGDLETAVSVAANRAQPGEVVLLAPACASFDQYRNYEERGKHFVDIVTRLGGDA